MRVEVGDPAGRARLRLLDLLRLIAALSVVLFHYTARYNTAWGTPAPQDLWAPLSSATAYGVLGVQLFFLISGFVVLMTAWGSDIPRYVASRVGRLYPAYWVGVILTGSLLFFDRSISIGGSWDSLHPSGLLMNLTMFQSAFGIPNVDGVYWTLWAELKFYILIGLFVLVGITRNRVILFAFSWPIVAALFSRFQVPLADEILMPDFAPFFATGMLLFVIYREGWSLATALPLAFNWLVMIHHAFETEIWTIYLNTLVPASPNVVAALYTAFIGVIVLVTQTKLASIKWRWLTVAGAMTYPLYLIHEIIGWWLISKLYPGPPKSVVLVAVLALMLLASYAIYRFVERPLGPRLRRAVEAGLRRAYGAQDSATRAPQAGRASAGTSEPQAPAKAKRPVTPGFEPGASA